MNADRNLTKAEQRARHLLAETELFDALGIDKLGFHARAVAHDVLELTAELAAERSARMAMQEARDRLQEIVGKAAYQACVSARVPTDLKGPEKSNVVPISRGAA